MVSCAFTLRLAAHIFDPAVRLLCQKANREAGDDLLILRENGVADGQLILPKQPCFEAAHGAGFRWHRTGLRGCTGSPGYGDYKCAFWNGFERSSGCTKCLPCRVTRPDLNDLEWAVVDGAQPCA